MEKDNFVYGFNGGGAPFRGGNGGKGSEKALGEEKRECFEEGKDCRCRIANRACVMINLCGKEHCIESNEVKLEKVKLKVEKYVSCRQVYEGEKIEFMVIIKNECDVCIKDAEFSDFLDDRFEFDKDSFKVNGKKETATFEGRTVKYKLGEIKGDNEAVIIFSCKVL